jgi:hypothetical protein
MTQTKIESFIEVSFNTFIGFIVAIASQLIIFPYFGIYIHFSENLWIGVWFTLISIIRSYIVRRWFNTKKFFQK